MPSKVIVLLITPEVEKMMEDIFPPRLRGFRQIIKTRMIGKDDPILYGETRPSYSLYSPSIAISDLRGMIFYLQRSLRGFPAQLFQFLNLMKNQRNRLRNRLDESQIQYSQFWLELITDIIRLIQQIDQSCDEISNHRKIMTGDRNTWSAFPNELRYELKEFDACSFDKLHDRVKCLDRYCQEVCNIIKAVLMKDGSEKKNKQKTKPTAGVTTQKHPITKPKAISKSPKSK